MRSSSFVRRSVLLSERDPNVFLGPVIRNGIVQNLDECILRLRTMPAWDVTPDNRYCIVFC